ncbi:MAG: hypothetical protein Q7S10_00965 [bacterium]|nr:hypothetical protein [bacterium]
MTDEEKKELLPQTSEEVKSQEAGESLPAEQEPLREERATDKTAEKELRKKIEEMHLDPKLQQQSKAQADDIKSLAQKEKLETLLKSAKNKGVIYAIHVAKSMDDPYILDTFHDMLVREGYYKEFKI